MTSSVVVGAAVVVGTVVVLRVVTTEVVITSVLVGTSKTFTEKYIIIIIKICERFIHTV